jgi:hypothetical protein
MSELTKQGLEHVLKSRFAVEGALDNEQRLSESREIPSRGSEIPLVAVQILQCKVTEFTERLRQLCILINDSHDLQGRSFLVPAIWGYLDCRCQLERVAMEVFEWHTRNLSVNRQMSGAEWWIQVTK